MLVQRLLLHGIVVVGGVLFLWALGQTVLIVAPAALAFSAGFISAAETKSKAVNTVSFAWLGGVILIALAVPMFSFAGPQARQAQCRNNMRQIALALYLYHEEYGSFPPA